MSTTDRYSGKPLTRLLELYVLWSIGELSDLDEKRLIEMTPKLQAVYGLDGTWQQVIISVMQIPVDVSTELSGMWLRNLELSRASGTPLTPQQFSERIVDENFAN